MEHPISEAGLRKFLAGTASQEETRAIVDHLLKGCPSCSEMLRMLAREEVPGDAYDNVLDRLEKRLAANWKKTRTSRTARTPRTRDPSLWGPCCP